MARLSPETDFHMCSLLVLLTTLNVSEKTGDLDFFHDLQAYKDGRMAAAQASFLLLEPKYKRY